MPLSLSQNILYNISATTDLFIIKNDGRTAFHDLLLDTFTTCKTRETVRTCSSAKDQDLALNTELMICRLRLACVYE